MNVVRRGDPLFAVLWEKLLSEDEIQNPLLSVLDVEYSKEYARDSGFEDASFVVEDQRLPILGVLMAVRTYPDGRQELSGFGRPIAYLESQKVDSSLLDGAARALREELQAILDRQKFAMVYYQELRHVLSPIGRYLLDVGARATPRLIHVINLHVPELALRSQVRKSYKSLINWGTKNLRLNLLDHASITPAFMDEFRLLHLEVSGRETRSHRTWELQFEMVRQKEAFIILGYMDGKLVTAGLFQHGRKYCLYGVAASRRELFEKPLGHSVLWTAILHAKSLGCRFFETGDQLFPNQTEPPPTPKELGISAFKRGFGGETRVALDIRLSRP